MSTAEIREWMNRVQNSAVESPETRVIKQNDYALSWAIDYM
jgi:hypothetical protein